MKTLIYVLTGGQSFKSNYCNSSHIAESTDFNHIFGILKNDELLRYIKLFLFLFSNKHEINVIIS